MQTIYLFSGAPRSGKDSTVNTIVKKHLCLPMLSMSAHLQKCVEEKHPEDWPMIKKMTDEGHLVPDEYAVPALDHALEALANFPDDGAFLNGSVRTVLQGEKLWQICEKHGWKIVIFDIRASDETIERRGKQRDAERIARGEKPRPDDAPVVFERRLKIFKDHTEPAIAYLVNKGVQRFQIEGNGSIEQSVTEVLGYLDLEGVTA